MVSRESDVVALRKRPAAAGIFGAAARRPISDGFLHPFGIPDKALARQNNRAFHNQSKRYDYVSSCNFTKARLKRSNRSATPPKSGYPDRRLGALRCGCGL